MLRQLQHGPVALAAGRTVEAVGPVVVDPLVVSEVPGKAKGLPTQVAHVTLLTVDSHVVAKGHVVGVGLAAEVTPGFGRKKRKRSVNSVLVRLKQGATKTNRTSESLYLKSPVLWVSLWFSKELACL